MKALRKIPVSIGFVQIPELELFHAKTTDKLDLKSLCSCGSRPKMRIACPDCQEEYTSWQKVPNRGYPISKSEFVIFSQEELESVRNNARKYETIEIEKVVDFKKLAVRYCFGDMYYLLPSSDANQITMKAYWLILSALDKEGWALLSKITLRNKVHRIALISDRAMGIIVGYKLSDRRDLPYEVARMDATEKEYEGLSSILRSAFSDDVEYPAEPDPLLAEIEKRLETIYDGDLARTQDDFARKLKEASQ